MLSSNERFLPMKIIAVIFYLLFFTGIIHAQTFVVFKGDTINRKDTKGLKQGLQNSFTNQVR